MSYVWKRLGEELDMNKTLDEIGLPDEHRMLSDLDIEPSEHYPALHIHFSDELNSARLKVN
jgi:hypothetical protein